MNLALLPDGVLLEVLGYLDVRQLLLARGVCRRLRDLALHPTLWLRETVVVEKSEDLLFQIAVLTLAPRLATLSFQGDSLKLMDWAASMAPSLSAKIAYREEWRRVAKLSVSAECAVQHLDICVSGTSSRAARILRNQMALATFRVSRLSLSVLFSASRGVPCVEAAAIEAVPAWCEVFSVFRRSGIPELHVDMNSNHGWLLFKEVKWPKGAFAAKASDGATLKRLEYTLGSTPDPVLNFLLETHALTLEYIDISGWDIDEDAERLADPYPLVSLIARCPNLRVLRCHLPTDFSELPCVGKLQKLSVRSSPTVASAGFFENATSLRSLSYNTVLTLFPLLEVLALSNSGLSLLESLHFRKTSLTREEWDRLAAALPGLPRLRKLKLDGLEYPSLCPPVSFLRALTPLTAPSLRRLRLGECYLLCPEPRNRIQNVRVDYYSVAVELLELVRRMPGLHVEGLQLPMVYCNEPNPACGCAGCSEGGSGLHLAALCTFWRRSDLDGFCFAPFEREFLLYNHHLGEECDLHDASVDYCVYCDDDA